MIRYSIDKRVELGGSVMEISESSVTKIRPMVWRRFFLMALPFSVLYQVAWGLAFRYWLPNFEVDYAQYPTIILFKLSSEVILYGSLALWLGVTPGTRIAKAFTCLWFIALGGVTTWELVKGLAG